MKKHKFISRRVKKFDPKPLQPDYYNIIKFNNRYFTLIGWLKPLNSDINYVLEEITQERLDSDRYLKTEYVKFIS